MSKLFDVSADVSRSWAAAFGDRNGRTLSTWAGDGMANFVGRPNDGWATGLFHVGLGLTVAATVSGAVRPSRAAAGFAVAGVVLLMLGSTPARR